METVTLETIALLPDGRPILSYGARGHDPALAGGLTSALYAFTQEIDLRKTPADGLKIDVPGGGKLVLRRAVLSEREVFVSVIVRGIVNEQILSSLSEFGHALGETITAIKDWRDIARGTFTSLFANKADIYLEALKRWRGATRMRPLVAVEFRDVTRIALSVLGKTVNLSESFIKNISNKNITLNSDELRTMVGKEVIVLAADQDLFLSLNTRDDPLQAALAVAEELKELKPKALIEAQRTFEEVKKSFTDAIGGSINGDTAFFRLSERSETWTNEIIQAVYRRMAKRAPHLLLAHPLLSGVGDMKGLRELVGEFVEGFLAEKGPYGMMKKLLSEIKADPALAHILDSLVEMCGPSFNEPAACLFVSLAGNQQVKDALLSLPESDTLSKSFTKSLIDTLSKEPKINGSPEWAEVKNRVFAILVQRYTDILEEMLLRRDLLIEKAKTLREELLKFLITFQVIAAMNALTQHKWKVVSITGQIPTYTELLSTGLASQFIKRENDSLVIEGEKHLETSILQDTMVLRKLWSNWSILSATLKGKMSEILKNKFYLPIQEFIEKYYKSMKENFQRYADFVKTIGTGSKATLELIKPEAERKIYEPLSDESEMMYDSIISLCGKSMSFIKDSVQEIMKSEGAKRIAIAKQSFYTIQKLEKEYVESPKENLTKQLDASFDRGLKKLDSEIVSLKEKIDSSFKLGPSFLRYVDGVLEAPDSAVVSYKLPPVEEFFKDGYSEILRTYAYVVLGLGVPRNLVERGVAQLRERKNVPLILKPLLKVKEANIEELVSMHLSEYVRMFTENAFSFATRHVDESYISKAERGVISIGSIPVGLMEEPLNYIGKPAGIEWNKNGSQWLFKISTPPGSTGEPKSLQEWLDDQFAQILQQKYGSTFELLTKIGKMLGPDISKRVEESIQRLKRSFLSSS